MFVVYSYKVGPSGLITDLDANSINQYPPKSKSTCYNKVARVYTSCNTDKGANSKRQKHPTLA